jgi:hypothetical protein
MTNPKSSLFGNNASMATSPLVLLPKKKKRRNLYQSIINLSEMWEGPNHLDAPSG